MPPPRAPRPALRRRLLEPRGERLYGWSAGEAIGRSVTTLTVVEDDEGVLLGIFGVSSDTRPALGTRRAG